MRISSGFFGIIAFIALIILTAICSLSSYGFARTNVIALWESGQQVENINEVAEAVLNPEDFSATSTPTPGELIVNLDPATAIPTAQPQTDNTTTVLPTATPDNSLVEPAQFEPTFTPQPIASPTVDAAQQAVASVGIRDINILLMGIDQRVGYDQERAYRTDTMMVVHIDPVRKSAGVISFPRDLWVEIPEYGNYRLNQANYIGDIQAYPNGGGPRLAMETLENNFGIRIDHYAMVNFTVFETLVDIIAPNGVEVCPTEYIYDPDYPDAGYGTIVVEINPGCQLMSGERLLQYARTRKSQNGDLDRIRRQQESLEALRQHVLSRGGVEQLLRQAASLWTELAGSYKTSLQLNEITGLALLMTEIERENIRYNQVAIGQVDPRTNTDGDQILVPINSAIQTLITDTFYPEVGITVADLRSRAQAENAEVRVYNNTDIGGLAGRTREYLIGLEVGVNQVGDMPTKTNSTTYICNYGGGDSTAQWIAELLTLPPDRVRRCSDGLLVRGVIVVIGSDMESKLTGQ